MLFYSSNDNIACFFDELLNFVCFIDVTVYGDFSIDFPAKFFPVCVFSVFCYFSLLSFVFIGLFMLKITGLWSELVSVKGSMFLTGMFLGMIMSVVDGYIDGLKRKRVYYLGRFLIQIVQFFVLRYWLFRNFS